MTNQLQEIEEQFKKIKNMNWIEGYYKGSCNVGKTFEKLLGIEENIFEIPDFEGVEIKTKRDYSKSYTSLFNMTPTSHYENTSKFLKDNYGYPDDDLKEYKVLNNSIFSGDRTWIGTKYQFSLKVDRDAQKIKLLIFNLNNELITEDIYWDFDTIKEKLYRKMKIVAYISSMRKFINNKEFFKYYKMEIYHLKNFETFINLIESGIIRITFKIGIFKTGDRKGQIHDHGTSFDIKKEDFDKLFVKYKTIY